MEAHTDAVKGKMEVRSKKTVKNEIQEKTKNSLNSHQVKEDDDKVKMDLDTILINEIGQFSWFQFRVLALAAIVALFSASNGEYVFTTARINARCLIPECEEASTAVFAPAWLAAAMPAADSCQRFASASPPAPLPGDSCPPSLFDHNVTQSCGEYVYENNLTVVYDFDLACDEWRRSLLGFARTLGTFFSLPLTGFVSDRWGRRAALAVNAFNTAWLGLLRYWANSYTSFITLEFIEAVFGSGVFSCAYILVLETVGPKYRVIAGGIISSSFALGQVCLGLVARSVPHWRRLTLTIYIPQLLTISYFWILSESVRWYLSKERYEELEARLKVMARVNGKQLSENSMRKLKHAAEEEKKNKAIEEAEKSKEDLLIVQVFRHKPILLRCMVLPVCWITTTMVYYGLSINSVNIAGSKYMNYVAVAAVEIPGFWLSVFLLSRVGRKPVLTGAFFVCAACQAAYVFMPEGNYGYSLSVYLVGKCCIATVVTAIYVYTTELYPTRYRHSLFAFSSMVGRIGSITAPLTPAMGAATFDEMPFVLFGALALLSGLLVLLTPETLGTSLPDTMEDADNIHTRK